MLLFADLFKNVSTLLQEDLDLVEAVMTLTHLLDDCAAHADRLRDLGLRGKVVN